MKLLHFLVTFYISTLDILPPENDDLKTEKMLQKLEKGILEKKTKRSKFKSNKVVDSEGGHVPISFKDLTKKYLVNYKIKELRPPPFLHAPESLKTEHKPIYLFERFGKKKRARKSKRTKTRSCNNLKERKIKLAEKKQKDEDLVYDSPFNEEKHREREAARRQEKGAKEAKSLVLREQSKSKSKSKITREPISGQGGGQKSMFVRNVSKDKREARSKSVKREKRPVNHNRKNSVKNSLNKLKMMNQIRYSKVNKRQILKNIKRFDERVKFGKVRNKSLDKPSRVKSAKKKRMSTKKVFSKRGDKIGSKFSRYQAKKKKHSRKVAFSVGKVRFTVLKEKEKEKIILGKFREKRQARNAKKTRKIIKKRTEFKIQNCLVILYA